MGSELLEEARNLRVMGLLQCAPTDERALQIFTIHEGTKVRIDQCSDEWVEIVLEDGKVGWVRAGVLEAI